METDEWDEIQHGSIFMDKDKGKDNVLILVLVPLKIYTFHDHYKVLRKIDSLEGKNELRRKYFVEMG